MRNTSDSDPPREPLKLETSSETKQGKCCLYIRCSGNLNFLGKILWEERTSLHCYNQFNNGKSILRGFWITPVDQVRSNFLSQL